MQTLLVPMVQTVEEAEQAVASTRYPPRGVRGFASASRSSRFGRVKDYHTRCEEEICVLVQIETKQGLDNLEAIAGVEGVDGVFIGPGDLSAGLGYLGDQGNPAFRPVLEDAMRRIKATGKAPGILTGDEALARRCIELGCLFTAVGADSGILARGSELPATHQVFLPTMSAWPGASSSWAACSRQLAPAPASSPAVRSSSPPSSRAKAS